MTTGFIAGTVAELLLAEDGVAYSLPVGEDGPANPEELRSRVNLVQAPAEVIEKALGLRKTTLCVYCRKTSNRLDDAFRGRGARYDVVVEILSTGDRLEELRQRTMEYADAVQDLIERKAGCLGNHLTLRDRVEVQYEGAKKGGLHLVETAKVSCVVEWRSA